MKFRFTILFLFVLIIRIHGQTPNIDSLIQQVSQLKSKDKVMLLSDISYYASFNNIELSVNYGKKCLVAAQKTGDSLLIAEGYNALAIALYAGSDYQGALENNQKALAIRLRHGDAYSLLSSYSKIGNCLHDLGKYDEAIPFYLKSLEICEDNNFIRQIGLVANNIAEILMNQENFEKAGEYYSKSIKIGTEQKDTLGLANAIINLGIAFMRQQVYSKADSLYSIAFALIKGKNFLDIEAGLYINYGVLNKEQGRFAESISSYRKAKNIYEKTGEIHGLAIVYSNLGNSFLEHNKYDSALVYYKKGVELAKATQSLTRQQYAVESLSNYYVAVNDYRKAYAYDSLADELRDSVYNIEKSKIIAELNTKYETEKKEKQLAQQEIELAQQEVKVQRKNTQLLSTSGSLFTLLVIGFFVYRDQKNKQEKLKQQVALEKAETLNRIQHEKLRISRDLHDNIGSQLTFVVSSLDNLNYIKEEVKRKDKLAQLSNFTKETMVQLRETIWALNSETITLDQLVSRIAEFINQAKIARPGIHFEIDFISSDRDLDANEAINIYRVIQEAINNALKYSEAKQVLLRVENDKISIIDNGIGFDYKSIVAGNGLANMKARMKEIGFRVEIDSAPGKGTKVTLWFA